MIVKETHPSSKRPAQLLTEKTEMYTAGLPLPPSALTSCAMLLRNTRPVPHPAATRGIHITHRHLHAPTQPACPMQTERYIAGSKVALYLLGSHSDFGQVVHAA